jgi:DNA-binding SARP family transcriptional activator/pimeloyl-ACP methyl ester carboxylesterase
VNLLGPVSVEGADGGEVLVGAAKERWLLAALALRPGSVIAVDALVDAIWGETAPPSARRTLQTYVSNLRRALGPDAVATHPAGYSLTWRVEDTDVGCFRALVRQGEQALRAGRPEPAREALGAAVALGRGRPLAGVGPHTGLAAEAVRLEEEFLSALESRIEADLAVGSGGELVGELEVLVRDHPLRERLWAHLLVALYRSGRQADALAAYQRVRRLLRDELGLQPGGELQRLERAILDQDPSLLAAAVTAAPASPAVEVRRSPVRYVLTPDGTHVAYQIVGNGPVDLLVIPGAVANLDQWWDAPTDHMVKGLASFSRVLLFDKRGMGLSDRPDQIDVEHWVEDALAVMDAAGSERAALLGISAGVMTSIVFAATHPQKVSTLILWGGCAHLIARDDPNLKPEPAKTGGMWGGLSQKDVDENIKEWETTWGTGWGIENLAPSLARDPAARDHWARIQSRSISPAAAARNLKAITAMDVRYALPAISSPTLVLHAARDENCPIAAGRAMCAEIEGARFIELDSDIHLMQLSDVIPEVTRHIEDFISGANQAPDSDRALATILAVSPATRTSHQDAAIDSIVERWRGKPFVGAGLPSFDGVARASFDGAARAVRCGVALASEMPRLGVALHSGECALSPGGVHGVAADISTQLAATAEPGEVLVSQTVRDLLLGSTIEVQPHRRQTFEGVPGDWQVFSVDSAQRASAP